MLSPELLPSFTVRSFAHAALNFGPEFVARTCSGTPLVFADRRTGSGTPDQVRGDAMGWLGAHKSDRALGARAVLAVRKDRWQV